ncbi:MAG: polysaccharide biosynthesis/export family protein [Acidobacteria bacterium]|nr:polysaccharide biosynthesis/export family protein [Acidobacteriota bacterium]
MEVTFLPARSFSFLFAIIIALSVSFAPASGQTASTQQETKPATAEKGIISLDETTDDDRYRVGPGDLLDIRVFGRPELNREARIGNQGYIRLPFLDEIRVACLTESEIAVLITEKYKKYLRDPQIDIFIKEYKSQPVAVIGSVEKPGRFQLQRRVRLLDLLTFAGGPTKNAGGAIQIIRGLTTEFCESGSMNQDIGAARTPPAGIVPTNSTGVSNIPDQKSLEASVEQGQAVLLSYRLKDTLLGNPEFNPYVKSGDVISLPETEQVFVIGGVVKPGPVSIRGTLTLMQAIGNAGGFAVDASKGSVKVVRTEPGTNQRKEMAYNINDIQKKRAEDIILQANDVIDVPTSLAKSSARSLLTVGIGALMYLPYYIIP